MAIISGGVVRMANLCVAGSHSVNGVSALHSEILKETVFNDFYSITPDKFKNVQTALRSEDGYANQIRFSRIISQSLSAAILSPKAMSF